MQWFIDNSANLMIVLGLALITVEIALLGLSVFILFFIGLACVVTGLLTMMGILPDTLIAAFGSVAVLSLLFAVALWKPLKKLQKSESAREVKGDFIGHAFVLDNNISSTEFSAHKYSGISWKIKSETPISAGTQVEVIKAEVGELTVATKV